MTTRRFKFVSLLTGVVVATVAFGISSAMAEEEGAAAAGKAAPEYPTSVESMIERRREAMERRKDAYWDALTGRRWRQAPWTLAQRDWRERRGDLMDENLRRRRDAMELRSDAWGRWMHPWSQWRQDWGDARRDAYDLSRLYRDEARDRAFYDRPFSPYAPWRW